MIDRAVTIAARVFAALLAQACAVGLAWGARAILRGATGDVLHGARLAIVLGTIAAGAIAAWRGWPPSRVLRAIPRRAFVGAMVVVALATGIWAHWKIERGVPDVPDELGYLHQARTFADGHLTTP